jgi:DNA modification methylase
MDDHRVICGDCRDTAVLTRLMDGVPVAASFCDAPYNVPILGNVSGLGKIKHGEFAMASGEMTDVQFFEFLVEHLTALKAICREGSVHYSCMNWQSNHILVGAIQQTGGTLLNICTWAKTNAGM